MSPLNRSKPHTDSRPYLRAVPPLSCKQKVDAIHLKWSQFDVFIWQTLFSQSEFQCCQGFSFINMCVHWDLDPLQSALEKAQGYSENIYVLWVSDLV